jgi:hypothetical protein
VDNKTLVTGCWVLGAGGRWGAGYKDGTINYSSVINWWCCCIVSGCLGGDFKVSWAEESVEQLWLQRWDDRCSLGGARLRSASVATTLIKKVISLVSESSFISLIKLRSQMSKILRTEPLV